tara:strand:+ start:330 stop:656 length:327 start_codon:yes stop_codon:yes gene_type:complete
MKIQKNINKALQLVDQAEEENKKTEKLISEGFDTDKNKIDKFKNKLIEVSSNFNELDQFTGRFLKHIYEHKKDTEKTWTQHANSVQDEIRHAPPIFNAFEQRKATLKR